VNHVNKIAKLKLSSRYLKAAVFCAMALVLAGCGHVVEYFGFIHQQSEIKNAFDNDPSAALVWRIKPEDCYLLIGKLAIDQEHRGPILIVAVTDRFKKREIALAAPMQTPLDYYQAYLPEGDYQILFFVDLDGNGYFDNDEMVGGTSGYSVRVAKSEAKDGMTVTGPDFTLHRANATRTDLAVKVKVRERSYVINSLDDEFFDPSYGYTGLFNPLAFLTHTQGYIFSLEKPAPEKGKTHIVFVHGIGGTPRDFRFFVEGLDRNRYHPWFYYYPSGMPLQKLGANLADIIKYSKKNNESDSGGVIIVAHSMGGLVSLSALNELCSDDLPSYLKGYVSFNSPYGGVDSAAISVHYAPDVAIVPAWRDLVSGGPFLERLYRGNALKSIPFYLFFSYKTGDSGDGTIDLRSQLESRVHLSASKSYGFNADHVSILNDEQVRQLFYRVLAAIDHR